MSPAVSARTAATTAETAAEILGEARGSLARSSPTVISRASDGWRPRFLLLVVDPDLAAGGDLVGELERHHVDVEVAASAADALVAAGTIRPDAVLVAAEPGGLSSAEMVRALGRRTDIPVVVGIGDGQGEQAGVALSSGATACIARPYRINELIPIVKSIRPGATGSLEPAIERGGLRLDPATLEVVLHGRPISLPLREYELLRFFMIHADRVVTRDQIYDTVWGGAAGEASNTIAVHIKRLRHRLGDGRKPGIILTVRGVGYRLVPPPANHRPG
jgi:DNA-binding response OmpR family regulator